MSVKISSYLQKNRYGIFYFRRAIPHSLRKHAGRTEVVCSLRTREPRQAVKQSRKVAILFDNWLEALESNVAKKKKGGPNIGGRSDERHASYMCNWLDIVRSNWDRLDPRDCYLIPIL